MFLWRAVLACYLDLIHIIYMITESWLFTKPYKIQVSFISEILNPQILSPDHNVTHTVLPLYLFFKLLRIKTWFLSLLSKSWLLPFLTYLIWVVWPIPSECFFPKSNFLLLLQARNIEKCNQSLLLPENHTTMQIIVTNILFLASTEASFPNQYLLFRLFPVLKNVILNILLHHFSIWPYFLLQSVKKIHTSCFPSYVCI